ncbi:Methyltransferase type 12 [Cellulomonas flavigena DSM 20109]|uniref:Methyltransferase type 12 n=1 Tax=Cellulomonas flavigena (strain ATCC 482 / DSM 20109 / BCRC 11376 / JCM 18109 / NBRC 3775 / NCIMB 8073 / NRS 134) TaxID=446466 RepID=D5UGL1_CELFN|nr:methyltransferase [Cellulomonas flavigena]ADG75109.1 Methyltransferase type 12 [Cellulomonas flavigena DSM 20109]
MDDDYLAINRANWDARVPVHLAGGYGTDELLAEPTALSGVVRFDLPRLGDVAGLDVVHLQCHLGTDTLSLARLGARVTGLDLSGDAVAAAADLAARAEVDVEYVRADVYSAVDALGAERFDLVYTGIGALCWLPDIRRWAQTVARLLRPGGRLFVRDAHPVLLSALGVVVGAEHPDRAQQPWITAPGTASPALELPYFEQAEPLRWRDTTTYAGDGEVSAPLSVEWNHGLGEIVTAVLEAGMELTSLHEHDSVPWDALPGLMTYDAATGECRLTDRPERLPASFTLTARLTPRA